MHDQVCLFGDVRPRPQLSRRTKSFKQETHHSLTELKESNILDLRVSGPYRTAHGKQRTFGNIPALNFEDHDSGN